MAGDTKRKRKINDFSSIMREIQPLISLSSQMANEEGVSINDKIGSIYKIHQDCLTGICEHLNLDYNSIDDRLVIAEASNNIGRLIKELCNSGESPLNIKEIVESLQDLNVSKSIISKVIKAGVFETDMLVNIKTALFPNAIKIKRFLSAAGFSDDDVNAWLSWYHSASIELGKDISFNWDPQSVLKDREALFQSCILSCSDIVFDEIRHSFISAIQKSDRNPVLPSLWRMMPKLHEFIKGFDVGYGTNEKYNMSWLEKRIHEVVLPHINSFTKEPFNEREVRVMTGYIAFKIEKIAISCWDYVSALTVRMIEDEISQLNKEQMDEWIRNEGSKVMDFSLFSDELEKRLSEIDNYFSDIPLNEAVLLSKVKTTTAKVWGMSDSICKIRTLNV